MFEFEPNELRGAVAMSHKTFDLAKGDLPCSVHSSCLEDGERGINSQSQPCLSWETNYLLAALTRLVDGGPNPISELRERERESSLFPRRLDLIHILLVFLICRGFAERAQARTICIDHCVLSRSAHPRPPIGAAPASQSVCLSSSSSSSRRSSRRKR